MSGYIETGIHVPYEGVRGARLEEAPPPDPDLATPEKIAEAQAGWAPVQAPFEDFEIRETAPGKYLFTDRATGAEYRRDPVAQPRFRVGTYLPARGISCFTIDAGGKLHYLLSKRRGEPDSDRLPR